MKYLSLFMVLVFALILNAQSAPTVSGRIIDHESDGPIPGVVVMQKNTTHGTTTDSAGYFTLQVSGEVPYVLVIKHLAYREFELTTSKTDTRGKGLVIHLVPLAHQTEEVIVTGNKSSNKLEEINTFTGTLNGKELDKALSGTIAQTIKDEAGISVRSMGPAPARPVIRGLGGDRIGINEDGFSSVDLSSTSPDHAVAIDPFTTYKIEVLRGPKVLLDNFSAMGGIVNVIKETIPTTLPPSITGMAGLLGESVNSGFTGGLSLKVPLKPFSIYSEGTYRNTADQNTPAGKLKNSSINNYSYALGSSLQLTHGYAGLSVREFNSEYRVPGGFVGAHPNGVRIVFFKREINAMNEYGFHHPYWEKVTVKASRNYFSQQEYEENNSIGAEFGVMKYEGSLRFDTKAEGNFKEGAIQITGEHRDFTIGGYVFTAPTKSNTFSLSFFQPYVVDNFTFELSGRYGYAELKPERVRVNQKAEYVNARHFNVWSLAASALYSITTEWSGGVTVSRSTRIPTIEELYSEGPHLAAYSYETGNPALNSELGYGTELFLHYKNVISEFYAAVYTNRFSYFIIPRNTGRINSQTLLPVYRTAGGKASISGMEVSFKTLLAYGINFSAQADYSYGQNTEEDIPLPQMPPLKGRVTFSKDFAGFVFSAGAEFSAKQERTDKFETSTAGYIVYNAGVQYNTEAFGLYHAASLTAENISNAEYRNHLSRVKIILPEAGFNLKLLYKLYF